MPIREYSCKKCGDLFENIEIEVTTGNVICQNCGSRDVQPVFSIFSGSGRSKTSCDVGTPYT